jgi:hypothetical protein
MYCVRESKIFLSTYTRQTLPWLLVFLKTGAAVNRDPTCLRPVLTRALGACLFIFSFSLVSLEDLASAAFARSRLAESEQAPLQMLSSDLVRRFHCCPVVIRAHMLPSVRLRVSPSRSIPLPLPFKRRPAIQPRRRGHLHLRICPESQTHTRTGASRCCVRNGFRSLRATMTVPTPGSGHRFRWTRGARLTEVLAEVGSKDSTGMRCSFLSKPLSSR